MAARGGDELRVLIAGGGVAALEAMVALSELAGDRAAIDLLAPDTDFFYRPLAVTGPFGLGEVPRFELAALARGRGARHHLDSVVAVYPEERFVRTSRNRTVGYDALLIAVGARQREALRGATTFRGEADGVLVRNLLGDVASGRAQKLVFALPGGVTWPLPLYELALLTADRLAREGLTSAELTIVTPEDAPLAVLGGEASETAAALLDERGIRLLTATYPEVFERGELRVVPGEPIPADRVLSVPRLRGIPIAGVPQDADYFVRTDALARVEGLRNVFAAGDITTFPVKQGGLAAQQADVAAEAIAARAGAPVTPRPFEPVLRALLLTGAEPVYMRSELGGGHGEPSSVSSREALWWPPAKIAARYLAPYLAEHAGSAYGPARAAAGSLA